MAAVNNVTEKDFREEVEESDIPVVVDFYAPWCGPCRMLAPIIEKVAFAYAGWVKVVKVNTDDSPNLSAKFAIRSIPTVIGFKDGKPVDKFFGFKPEDQVEGFFKKLAS